ncbi:MAG: hypothetical protein WBD20_20475 [Pirellulaceae bacterium]
MSRTTKPARIQLWLDRLNRQAASHQSVAEFCLREEISLPSFYQWKRRLAPRVDSPPKRCESKPTNHAGFTELVVQPASTSAHATLPGGITITLGSQPEMAGMIVDRLLQQAFPLAANRAP